MYICSLDEVDNEASNAIPDTAVKDVSKVRKRYHIRNGDSAKLRSRHVLSFIMFQFTVFLVLTVQGSFSNNPTDISEKKEAIARRRAR